MRNHSRRLQRIEQQVLSQPLAREVLERTFAVFKETGELPEDQRLAYAVVQCTQTTVTTRELWARAINNLPPPPEDLMMNALYDEAVFATGMIRSGARAALVMLADFGLDPTKPLFAGLDAKPPECEPVGLHLIGFPGLLAKRPYTRQAVRLFKRIGRLRQRLPQTQQWSDHLNDATQRFRLNGELPADGLVMDAVLALGEMLALMEHAAGEDVAEMMAAFDAAARSKGDAREIAIARVQELVRARQLLPAGE